MSTFALVSVALGVAATVLSSALQTSHMAAWTQAVLALVVSTVLGAVQVADAGKLAAVDWHSLHAVLGAAVVVFGASQAVFHSLWKNTPAAAWLEQLGTRTKTVEAKFPPEVEQAVTLLAQKLLEQLASIQVAAAPAAPAAVPTMQQSAT